MKTLNEQIAGTEAAILMLKQTTRNLPPELQSAQIMALSFGGRITIDASQPNALQSSLECFGREGWKIAGSGERGITASRKEPNGVLIIIENIPSSTPAIGSDATPYLNAEVTGSGNG